MNLYSYTQNDPINYIDTSGQNKAIAVCNVSKGFDTDTGYIHYWSCKVTLYLWGTTDPYDTPDLYDSGVNESGGGALPTLREIMMGYMDGLLANPNCVAAIGEDKIKEWKANVDRGDVNFYNHNQSAVIPNKGGQTVSQYWDALSFADRQSNGATVVSGPKRNASGAPDPNGHYNNARVYNTIILNTNYESTTMIHEFLHWQVSGDHVAIADADHLDLKRFGYKVDNDKDADNAINDFFAKGCK